MGRLENIIARNQRPQGSRERLAVLIGFCALVLIVTVLMVFTDLGMPPTSGSAAPAGSAVPAAGGTGSAGPARGGKRVDGVFLGTPARRAR